MTSFFAQIVEPLLQWLEALENVAMLALIIIAVRQVWVAVQKRRRAAAAISRRGRRRDRRAAKGETPTPGPRKDYVLEVIDTILIAVILVFGVVRPFLLQTFYIPSASMEPTLLGPWDPRYPKRNEGAIVQGKRRGGDKLIANKFVLRFRPPRRGEVIVFRPPLEAIGGNDYDIQRRTFIRENPGLYAELTGDTRSERELLASLPPLPAHRDDYIKRVIAVPGDRVKVVGGEGVYVNDRLIREPYLPKGRPRAMGSFPQRELAPKAPPKLKAYLDAQRGPWARDPDAEFEEAFGDWLTGWYRFHFLYNHRIKPYVDADAFVVPDNAVFVMGDNRSPNGSFDSRWWGVVRLENVKARAVTTFWPLNRLKLL